MIFAVAFPKTGRRGGRNGDATLLFLLHPVHGRRALVHLADFVRDARVIKDTFRRGGLTSIDVRHDADIPELTEVVLSHFVFWVRTLSACSPDQARWKRAYPITICNARTLC